MENMQRQIALLHTLNETGDRILVIVRGKRG